MSADYVVDESRGLVLSRAWGRLTDGDLLEHQRRVRNDPRFRPDLNQLFDFQDVDDIALTARGINKLAEGNPFGRGARRAFVIRTGALAIFGLMRMFQTLTSEHPDELRVQFDDLDAAMSWLETTNQ